MTYPYAPPSEQFIHNEIKYLSSEFDQVLLFLFHKQQIQMIVKDYIMTIL